MCEQTAITPLRGVSWQAGEICLGDQEQELSKRNANFEKYGNSYYYDSRNLRVDISEKQEVEFIELSREENGAMSPVLCNVPVFENEVGEVLRQLEKYGPIEERENGHMYVLPELEAALWRERTETDVEEFIVDMKADGIAVEGNPDVESEWKLAKYFQTIAIGRKGYFSK
ncbi:MAG: hypothetical protein J6A77_11190 [Lachnospiraceae bacterium]|nr:hypothetical protein [Lachnospiraceae bacterium]